MDVGQISHPNFWRAHTPEEIGTLAVNWIREQQFERNNSTYQHFREHVSRVLARAEEVIRELSQETQKIIDGRPFKGKGIRLFASSDDFVLVVVDRTIGCDAVSLWVTGYLSDSR